MAEFNIDIPGVGKVTVQGNFATEDSINRLAASFKSGKAQDPINNLKKTVNETSNYLDSLEVSIGKNKKSVDKLSKSFNEGTKSFNHNFSKVDGVLHNLSDPGSGALTKLVKTVGEAGAGLGKGILGIIPIIGDGLGTAFSSILGMATAITTEAIGFAQGLVDVNKDINNAGLGLVRGLDDLESAASNAGVPFQQFSKALLENVDSIRLMTGGVQGGVDLISKSLKRLDKDSMQMLYSIGFTVEDIIGTMTDLAATASMTGKTLSDAELADATNKYLRNQQELARITGISVKEQKNQLEASRRSVFIQSQLQGLTNEQRIATQGFLNVLKDPGLQEYALKGFTTDKDVIALMQFLPNFGSALQEVTQGVKSGALTQEQAIARYKELVSNPAIADELARAQRTLGVTIESNMGGASGIAALLGQIQTQLTQQYTQSGVEKAVDYQKKTIEGMNKSVAAIEQLIVDVNAGLSTFGFTLFNFVDGYLGDAADATGNVVDRFQALSTALKEYNLAREKRAQAEATGETGQVLDTLIDAENKAKEKLVTMSGKMSKDAVSLAGSLADSLIQKFVDSALYILGELTTSLSDAIVDGFDRVLESTLGSLYTSKAEIKPKIEELPVGAIDHVQKYMLKLDELTEKQLNELNIKKEKTKGWFGEYSAYSKIKPNISIPNTDASRQNITPELSIPNQALGNVFEPRSGGHIIRVAEAMEPEIVAPAERDPNTGKLGLTVSGVMLDNSQLLKNMLEANRSSTQLLAALNSRFENLNKSMQDLVHEQKTANRLAV